jgi:hypothetical protein
MHEGCGLQGVALSFAPQVRGSQLAKLAVDERHEFRHGPLVALPPFREEPCYFMGSRGSH